jgi:hypothetical protein
MDLMVAFARLTSSLVLAGGLSACAVSAVDPNYVSTWDPKTVNYMAAKGAVFTQIVGNPFLASQAEFERTVTGAMAGANFGQPLRFSTQKDSGNRSPYRVVMVFNAKAGFTPQNLCDETAPGTRQADGPIQVMAALCAGTSRETSVTARYVATSAGHQDPALKSLLRQVTQQLFPSKNDNILGNPSAFDL